MKKIIKRFRILILIYITFTAIATYFSIYMPSRDILIENAFENFILQIKYEKGIIEQYLTLYNEYSIILSTDFDMVDEIASYKKGNIDRQTLESRLDKKYKGHASEIGNLIFATRFIDDEAIVSYKDQAAPEQVPVQSSKSLQGVIISNGDIAYKVYSPILIDNNLLGYDILVFNINNIFQSLDDYYTIKFIDASDSKGTLLSKIEYSKDNINLYFAGDKVVYVGRLSNTDSYLYYEAPESYFYKSFNRMRLYIFISGAISLIVITTLTNIFIVKNAGKLLAISEDNQEKYRQYAIKDPLSGSYSRLFFENWLENQAASKDSDPTFHYTITIIDIDNFKAINDSYGHLDGDKAIKTISSVLLGTVRSSDYVIRYGGDEFLIIFKDCTEETARDIMQRVEDKLKKIDTLDFEVTISYGVHEVVSRKDILEAIRKADKQMYAVKKSKYLTS